MALVASIRDFIGISRYRGAVSDHFDGRRFRNLGDAPALFPTLKRYRRECEFKPWQHRTNTPHPLPPKYMHGSAVHTTFINHATFLLQTYGKNILTDPVWGDRAAPVPFSGNPRFRKPGLLFEHLPPIDAVLLSHNHNDHCDLKTLKRLQEEHPATIYTGLGNAAFLRRHGIHRVVELDWWQRARVGESLQVDFVPAQHSSRRGIFDLNRSLWGGFVVQSPEAQLYFAGDTGMGPHFAEIARRYSKIALGLLPIGSYEPRGLFHYIHLSPPEAIAAHKTLGAQTSIGMHFGTFRLTGDEQDQPVHDLQTALQETNNRGVDFKLLAHGASSTINP